MRIITKLWIAVVILVLLCPLGLIVPAYFKAGTPWGEWGIEEIKRLSGYIPKGLERLSKLWNAPIPDYAFKGWEEKGLKDLSFAYIISALVGIAILILLVMLIGKLLVRKGD